MKLEVDVNAFPIQRGDIFLLCSDGLYKELSDSEIRKIIKKTPYNKTQDKLLEDCLSREAKDNVSLIVVKAE